MLLEALCHIHIGFSTSQFYSCITGIKQWPLLPEKIQRLCFNNGAIIPSTLLWIYFPALHEGFRLFDDKLFHPLPCLPYLFFFFFLLCKAQTLRDFVWRPTIITTPIQECIRDQSKQKHLEGFTHTSILIQHCMQPVCHEHGVL